MAVACGALGVIVSRGMVPSRSAPPEYGILPDFSLIDQQGRPFRRADLSGAVWIASFIFTRCAGQCPLMSAEMGKLQDAFAQTPTIHLLSISVDPEHDRPEVLAAYAQHYGARPGRWRFVTGSRTEIMTLAQEGFRLSVAEGGSPSEPITHSVRLVLIDARGRIRGYYDATDPSVLSRLVDDARRLAAGRA